MVDRDHGSIVGDDQPLSDARTLIFRGTDGYECENFVRAVRMTALAEGKDDDDRWMLHFATARLSGRAMRWHARLEKAVRKDWDLLVQALLDEYPVDYDESTGMPPPPGLTSHGTSVITAPQTIAAPPVSLPQPLYRVGPGAHAGRIKVIPDMGTKSCPYVLPVVFRAGAAAIEDALHVHFVQSDPTHSIGVLPVLGIANRLQNRSLFEGSVFIKPQHLSVDWFTSEGPKRGRLRLVNSHSAVSNVWNVGPDGTFTAYWNGNHECEGIQAVAISPFDGEITFVEDYDRFISAANEPTIYYKARLVFEPMS